jgi:SAM-dependent methyltransferase
MPGRRYRAVDLYELPRYYGLIFGQEARLHADFAVAMLHRHARTRRRAILEPACGPAHALRELARRGYPVTGFDLSRPMIEHARALFARDELTARLRIDRMETFSVRGPFALAFNFVSTFRHLTRARDARAHLLRIADALAPGGLYLLGLHLTPPGDARGTAERWTHTRGRLRLVWHTRFGAPDRRRRLERLTTRVRVIRPRGEERLETAWDLRTYDAAQLRALLRSIPALELVACHDFEFDPGSERRLDDSRSDIVLVLRRRPMATVHC